MIYLIIRHKVEDFSKWKPKYDAHGAVRKRSGCRSEQLLRASGDPNDLVILFEWDSIENARSFVNSSDLRESMRAAGVIGTPDFQYLEQVERKTAGLGTEKAA
jgi:heme-degrading monooxygenase HmoA